MKKITILDGGMGREIKKRLHNFDPILWSASALLNHQKIVKDIHKEFLNAGSTIITTNNYTVVPYVLKSKNIFNQFEKLTNIAGNCAREAIIESRITNSKVAGCLPPLKLTYRPDLIEENNATAYQTYTNIINWLDPYVDLYLAESLTSIIELNQILEATKHRSKPLYVSFILDDANPKQLLDKTSISELIPLVNNSHIKAFLFNCCQPKTVTEGLDELTNLTVEYGAYANAFKSLNNIFNHGDFREISNDINIEYYINSVKDWLSKGATIVGGCCGIGPDYIHEIKNLVTSQLN